MSSFNSSYNHVHYWPTIVLQLGKDCMLLVIDLKRSIPRKLLVNTQLFVVDAFLIFISDWIQKIDHA